MLFILAIASLIGLMSTGFVQDMVSSWSQIRDFYQSYYIAKWGLELGTLAVNRYEYGFEDTLSGSQNIIKNNLYCNNNCKLDITINSRIKPQGSNEVIINEKLEPVVQCTSFTPNRFRLSPGQSYILPLFTDLRKLSSNNSSINTIQNVFNSHPKYYFKIVWDSSQKLWLGVALGWAHQEQYDVQGFPAQQALFISWTLGSDNFSIDNLFHKTPRLDWLTPYPISISEKFYNNPLPGGDKDYFNYFYITNMSETPFQYCLTIGKSEHGFISDKSIVTAISIYGSITLWLQAHARKPLLEYIIRPNTEL